MARATVQERNQIARWVEPKQEYPGDADANIAGTGTPVWALIGYYQASDGDIEGMAEDYRLPLDAIEAALAYYKLHRELINARLAANHSPSA